MKRIIFISLFSIVYLHASTLVYNLRIAETTKRQAAKNTYLPRLFALALVSQWTKFVDDRHQTYTGGIANFLYSRKAWYIQATGAAAHVHEKKDDVEFSRTQADDILLSAGYSTSFNKRTRFTFSAMIGIPTHKDVSPEGLQFGTGHVGLGMQLDGAFFYAEQFNRAVLAAARYIRFFPRNITISINEQPVPFTFNIGNAIDLFIAHNSWWGHHQLEVGYNPTFVFQAKIVPHLDIFIDKTNFIRSSFFGSYHYGLVIRTKPSAVSLGLSYGFEHIPKDFRAERILSAWISWGINF